MVPLGGGAALLFAPLQPYEISKCETYNGADCERFSERSAIGFDLTDGQGSWDILANAYLSLQREQHLDFFLQISGH